MQDIINVLEPIFQKHSCLIKPASELSLRAFRVIAYRHGLPEHVIEQLISFYSQVGDVPCLDSLDIHSCDDESLFEWWRDGELWLGTRDCYILRWSSKKGLFCIGDASNISFSKKEEFGNLADSIIYLVNIYS